MSENNDNTSIEYRDIANFPGYRAGSNGEIQSCWKRLIRLDKTGVTMVLGPKWKTLKSHVSGNGYVHVVLHRNGRKHIKNVHRIILECFRGPCPPNKEARHINGIRSDNRLSNLAWSTHLENMADQIAHGTSTRGTRNGSAKLTEADVRKIVYLQTVGFSCTAIANRLNITPTHVCRIIQGKCWQWLTGIQKA